MNTMWGRFPRTVSVLPEEPLHFNDDEPLDAVADNSTSSSSPPASSQTATLKSFTELPAIAASESISKFAVLVGVKAPSMALDDEDALYRQRAPIDLVTVLDVSGSMHGEKLGLLKLAVGFVIENMGPSDRLSIVTFSDSAQRIFPLRRMSERGREDAFLAVNALRSQASTNILTGLKKGVRVLEERRHKNPVSSIILLSDGLDTYGLNKDNVTKHLPASICPEGDKNQLHDWVMAEAEASITPVHTFGFGVNHDPAMMHAISDASAGTFNFIQAVEVVQDAFARCIGGLLSVVAQQVRLTLTTAFPGVRIESIPSGRYRSEITEQGQKGVIDVGDLYADEEKQFLVYVSVPKVMDGSKTSLLDFVCSFRYTTETNRQMLEVKGERVEIRRPEVISEEDKVVSVKVDRQRNRVLTAEAIKEAQAKAEGGDLDGAREVLTRRKLEISSSVSALAGDFLCLTLEAEMTQIGAKMGSQRMYEVEGRACALANVSSHLSQRANTRGGSSLLSFGQLELAGREEDNVGMRACRRKRKMILTRAEPPRQQQQQQQQEEAEVEYSTPFMRKMVEKSQKAKESN